jgi:hypothetical protein
VGGELVEHRFRTFFFSLLFLGMRVKFHILLCLVKPDEHNSVVHANRVLPCSQTQEDLNKQKKHVVCCKHGKCL